MTRRRSKKTKTLHVIDACLQHNYQIIATPGTTGAGMTIIKNGRTIAEISISNQDLRYLLIDDTTSRKNESKTDNE